VIFEENSVVDTLYFILRGTMTEWAMVPPDELQGLSSFEFKNKYPEKWQALTLALAEHLPPPPPLSAGTQDEQSEICWHCCGPPMRRGGVRPGLLQARGMPSR
jgi:hypothetical protein